jgi:hypothetical protein
MNYGEFLNSVIDDGLKSVETDEWVTKYPKRLEGARAGFESCRGLTPGQLRTLLREAQRSVLEVRSGVEDDGSDDEEYWKAQYRALQVEWVANTVSAMLMNQGQPVIVTPTARGVINAARIIGASV